MDNRTADSGMDPAGNWRNFLKRESTLDKYRSNTSYFKTRSSSSFFENQRGKVPYGTTKCTYKLGLDENAKLRRYGSTLEP